MGWGIGDPVRVEQAKVKLSAVKAAAYSLHKQLQEIRHDEKRRELLRACDNIDVQLDDIERTLTR